MQDASHSTSVDERHEHPGQDPLRAFRSEDPGRGSPSPRGGTTAGLRARTLLSNDLRTAALVPALLAIVVLVGLVAVSVTGSWLAMLLTLAQLPFIVGVAILHGRRCSALVSATDRLSAVGTHAEKVQAALSRDEETLHEVRATIVGLSLAVHLLQEAEDDLPEATRIRLETMHASELERLERLLADGPRAEPLSVPLAEVIDPFVDSVRARGQRVHWSGTQHHAWGRRDEISEVVHVLLENVHRHAPSSDVAVDVSSARGLVELRVVDHGPGVPPELAPLLFDRGTRGRHSPGQGIGLHLAQRLSREMGGDLRLEPPVPGVGAAFVLTLPVERVQVLERGEVA